MGRVFYMDWEVQLIEWLQSSLGNAGTKAAEALSYIGSGTVSLMVLLVMYFCWSKAAAKRCCVIILAASGWFPMIKNIVLRLRPYMAHETVKILLLPEKGAGAMDVLQQGYSFPSGHSAMAMGIYGSLAREIRKKWMWTLGILLSLLIGISRFVVGAHYPTDVLAGWGVGLAAIAFGAWTERKIGKERTRYLILLLTLLPGLFYCKSQDYFSTLGVLAGVMAAFPFEERHAGFEDTRNPLNMVLRVAGAAILYYGLNLLLKMPFSGEFLNSGTLTANLVRSLRYAVLSFLILGVYPMCFRFFPGGRKRTEA